jgi:hypothetical protein
VTWRLVLASLFLGFGLAALSVPVCAMGPWTSGIRARPPTPGKQWHWFEPQHAILYTERSAVGLGISGYSMVPVPAGQEGVYARQFASLEYSDFDRRPAWAVAPFGGNNEVVLAVAAGWPWLAASGQDCWLQQLGTPRTHMTVARFELGNQQYRVPYLPLWTGLAANSLFYTPFALGVLVLLARGRRWRLRRRGLCVCCRYDLSSSGSVCPECGALDQRRANRTKLDASVTTSG